MAQVLKPTVPIILDCRTPAVFLAGSIEMGTAENWQNALE